MPTLGCANTYKVELGWVQRLDNTGQPLSRAVRHTAGTVDAVTRIRWGRLLNDVSECIVEIGGTGAGACCTQLELLQPYVWELRVWRDATLVWEGPIVHISETGRSEPFTITAADPLVWLTENHIANTKPIDYTSNDPTSIAWSILRRNLFNEGDATDDRTYINPPDSPLIWDFVHRDLVGTSITYNRGRKFVPVIDLWEELTEFGLQYTTVGRSILLIGGATTDTDPAARLTQDDFDGPITITHDGDELGTWGIAVRENDWQVTGTGASPYGPHIRVVDVDYRATTSEARQAAAQAIQGRSRPATVLTMSNSTRLYPHAPIPIELLIPGRTRVDVHAASTAPDTGWCQPVSQPCTFGAINVDWVPGRETVQVGLIPIGDPTQVAPEATTLHHDGPDPHHTTATVARAGTAGLPAVRPTRSHLRRALTGLKRRTARTIKEET